MGDDQGRAGSVQSPGRDSPWYGHSDRGQSGLGTLIILIAAVLVSAIAAGVFFDVAGLLEGQTEATSEDVQDQLDGRLRIIAVTGQIQNGEIEVVNVTVRAREGAVDLRDVSIQWLGPTGSQTLVWAGNDASGATFGITAIDGDGPVLDSGTDSATLTIDPGTGINATTTIDGQTVDIEETGPPLQENDEVTLNVLTDSRTTYRFTVPSPLRDSGTVEL